jgi:hypothetical protein
VRERIANVFLFSFCGFTDLRYWQLFTLYHKQGSAVERHVTDGELFDRIVAAAKEQPRAQYFAGEIASLSVCVCMRACVSVSLSSLSSFSLRILIQTSFDRVLFRGQCGFNGQRFGKERKVMMDSS